MAAFSAAVMAAPAQAATIISPSDESLARKATLKVKVRAAGGAFRARIGSRDVSRRFRRVRGALRVAQLRRGADIDRGFNRMVVSSGRGARRRSDVLRFVVGTPRGALRVRRLPARGSLRLRIAGRGRPRFDSARIMLNGRRVRSRDWVPGERTPSWRWPARRRFQALFGADEGLRFGRNRLTITTWSRGGAYARSTHTFRMSRAVPIASAGRGRTLAAGRPVRLDARASRPRGGAGLRYRWRIVRRPKGSKIRLRGARSARPRLTPDLNGRYRIRLQAFHRRKARPGSAGAAAGGADETTVVATAAAGPIGVTIDTIAGDPASGGGVQVDDQLIPASPGSWVQLVVLDRSSYEPISNQSFGDSTPTGDDAESLYRAVLGLDSDQLAILSAGNRQVSADVSDPAGELMQWLFDALVEAGGNGDWIGSLYNWRNQWESSFAGGTWSMIGVPEEAGSGYANLFGTVYGRAAGAGSFLGNLSGYLQQDLDGNYTFVSSTYTTIDTNAPGSPPDTNTIQVAGDAYTSAPVPSGMGGFHVLFLDSLLNRTEERTFITNDGSPNDVNAAVVQMQQFISDRTAGNLGSPGYLVVVQSIGNPFGSERDWVNDEPLVNHLFGPSDQNSDPRNVGIPRSDFTWYAPSSSGESLAGALGQLGGQAAHDQIAQMLSPSFLQPSPAYNSGGYTLIASTGALDNTSAPVDLAATPLSRSQAGSNTPVSRVTGTLKRDRQGLWEVDNEAWTDGFATTDVANLLFQAPTPWPLSQTQEQQAAINWISTVGLEFNRDIRDEYLLHFDDEGGNPWDTYYDELQRLDYPENQSGKFDQATFEAVQNQLGTEFNYVSEVVDQVTDWRQIFTSPNQELKELIDLQNYAADIASSITALDSTSDAESQTDGVIGESLWVASYAVGPFDPEGEIATALGATAVLFDLLADLESPSSTGPSAGVVTAEAGDLAEEMADQYDNLSGGLMHIGQILVSDWGKLQASDAKTKNDWNVDGDDQSEYLGMIQRSAGRGLTTALLASTYIVYVMDPQWVDDVDEPQSITCRALDSNSERVPTVRPFRDRSDNAASWVERMVGFDSQGNRVLRDAGVTLEVSVEKNGIVKERSASVPQAVAGPLFSKPDKDNASLLGVDPLGLMADTRFPQKWFYCAGGN